MASTSRRLQDLLYTSKDCLAAAVAASNGSSNEARDLAFDEMAAAAVQLHRELEEAGIAVPHSRAMLKNRGRVPSDPAFYKHLHPVKDLIKFAESSR